MRLSFFTHARDKYAKVKNAIEHKKTYSSEDIQLLYGMLRRHNDAFPDGLWSPSAFYGGRRLSENFDGFHLAVLDVDGKGSAETTIHPEVVANMFHGIAGFVHTTRSHIDGDTQKGMYCYRIVFFLSKKVDVNEIEKIRKYVFLRVPGIDKKTMDVARVYFTPNKNSLFFPFSARPSAIEQIPIDLEMSRLLSELPGGTVTTGNNDEISLRNKKGRASPFLLSLKTRSGRRFPAVSFSREALQKGEIFLCDIELTKTGVKKGQSLSCKTRETGFVVVKVTPEKVRARDDKFLRLLARAKAGGGAFFSKTDENGRAVLLLPYEGGRSGLEGVLVEVSGEGYFCFRTLFEAFDYLLADNRWRSHSCLPPVREFSNFIRRHFAVDFVEACESSGLSLLDKGLMSREDIDRAASTLRSSKPRGLRRATDAITEATGLRRGRMFAERFVTIAWLWSGRGIAGLCRFPNSTAAALLGVSPQEMNRFMRKMNEAHICEIISTGSLTRRESPLIKVAPLLSLLLSEDNDEALSDAARRSPHAPVSASPELPPTPKDGGFNDWVFLEVRRCKRRGLDSNETLAYIATSQRDFIEKKAGRHQQLVNTVRRVFR